MRTYEETSRSYTDSNGKVQSIGYGETRIRQVYKLEADKAFMEVTGYNNVFKAFGRPGLQVGDVAPYEIDVVLVQLWKPTSSIRLCLSMANY